MKKNEMKKIKIERISSKRTCSLISFLIMVIVMLTGCGKEGSYDESESVANSLNNQVKVEIKDEGTEIIERDGAFLQTDITPEEINGGNRIAFSQGKESNYLLSIADTSTENLEPRSFSYKDGKWTEKNNEAVLMLLAEKGIDKASSFSDFSDNWWIIYIEDNKAKGWKIAADGSTIEIELSSEEDVNYINQIQISEDGIISLRISHGETNQETGNVETSTIFLNTNTGELIDSKLPNSHGDLIGKGFRITDYYADTKILYDVFTGEVIDTYIISDYTMDYSLNEAGELYAFDNTGIYTIVTNGSLNQVVVDDLGYAYADTGMWMNLLADNVKDTTYMAVCEYSDSLKVYEYAFDKNASTSKSQTLEIWAFEDSNVVRDAIAVFSRENPDCEVDFEFGKVGFAKSGEDSNLLDEDIIKKMNAKLLAGEAPDVLFLDGLSVDAFYRQGMLSDINIELDQSLYYEKIVNSYTEDGVAYAYPTYFQVPVFVSSDTTSNIEELNTLEDIATLYQNPEMIFNDWYKDLFRTFFYASYHDLFPDNLSVDEAALNEFFTQTKRMVENQAMNDEPSYSLSSGDSTSQNNEVVKPSLWNFTVADPNESPTGKVIPYATGIFTNHSDAKSLYLYKDNIEVEPLLEGCHINQLISSIPKDAKNKEMAEKFISILLTNNDLQGNGQMGFPVKKEVGMNLIIKSEAENPEWNSDFKSLDEFHAKDWDSMLESLENSCQEEYLIFDIVYEQGLLLYENELPINATVSKTIQRLNLLFAERN